MKTLIKNSILLFSLALILSCTQEKPLPNGFSSLQRDKGAVLVKNFYPRKTAQFWSTPVAGRKSDVMLGSYDQANSYVSLFFKTLSSIDTSTVYSAQLLMYQHAYKGNGTSFTANIYPINIDWDESNVVWTELQNNYDSANLVGQITIPAADSAVVIDSLRSSLINSWVKEYWALVASGGATVINKGLMLVPQSATFIASFYSTDAAVSMPTLRVIYRPKAGGIDTVDVSADLDATLLQVQQDLPEKTLTVDPQYLTISNLWGYYSLLRFDVSSIPVTATIHQAILTLGVEQNLSSTSTDGILIYAMPVVNDSTWNPATVKGDSVNSASSAYGLAENTSVSFSSASAANALSGFVQGWTTGAKPNYGLLLKSTNYGNNTDKLFLLTSKNDTTLAPVLKVTYSVPPSSRFK